MKGTLWAVGGAVLLAALFEAGRAEPAPEAPIVRVDPAQPDVVVRWSPGEAGGRAFYRAAGPLIALEVAPDARHVAFLETDPGIPGGGEYARAPTSRLGILDANGRLVRSVADVWRLEWSPDGRKIAFITGTYFEGGVGFAPDEARVLDVTGGESRPLEGLRHPHELRWLRTAEENALYARVLGDGEARFVARYDLDSDTVSRPASPAFHFSPDGEFYYLEPHEAIEVGLCSPGRAEDGCLRVFERAGDRLIRALGARDTERVLGWVVGEGHQLILAESVTGALDARARGLRVVDVAAGKDLEVRRAESADAGGIELWKSARGVLPPRP